jgi:hypothetical protein
MRYEKISYRFHFLDYFTLTIKLTSCAIKARVCDTKPTGCHSGPDSEMDRAQKKGMTGV